MNIFWLFGRNVAKSNTMFVTVDGIAFSPKGLEAIIKNLRARNKELEASNRRLTKAYAEAVSALADHENSIHRSIQWRKVDIQHA